MKKRLFLLLLIFCISALVVFSQAPQTSKDNYTGAWESPTSWNPTWAVPQTTLDGFYFPLITINGYITVNGNLSFSGSVSNLIINDTLVILGNLLLDNFNDLTINTNGILIVRGNLIFNNNANVITTNGYLIITGNVLRGGPINNGSFTSISDPVKVFIGGVINPADLTENKPNFSALNCLSPTTVPYPSSNCSYGNSTDLSNDPINTFFQNTCSAINVNSNISVCEGNAINLTSSSGTSYSWSGPNGFTSSVRNPSIPNASISMAGDYTITLTVPTGCTDKDTTRVVVNALPVATAGSNSPVCVGNTINLTSSGGTSYSWTGPNGFTSSAQNPSIPNANLALSGAYTVTVTAANGCTITKTINVVVAALPATPTITAGGPTTFCDGGSVTLTSSAGTSYLWSNGATTASINVTTAGTYTVRVSNASGCQSAASVATIITVNALPLQPTISANGPTTFCAGSSVILTSSAGTSYLWSNGATTPGINVTTAGSYTVRVSNASGCQSAASEATIVTVNDLPATPTITADGPIIFCAGGSVTLTSDAGASYLWSNGATTASINVTAAGTYTVRVSNANGCQSAASIGIIVTVNALPATPTITPGGPTTFCTGGSVTLTSSAGTGYLWSNGATTASIIVTTAGNYTVRVINVSGCQSAASTATIVTVNTLPASPTITTDGPTTFCTGGNVTLTSTSASAYIWSNGANTQSINVTIAGNYTVRVTNANGCQSATSTATIVTVNVLPASPTITADGPNTFCTGGSVTLTSGAGTSYLWSNGATTPGIVVSMSGSYTVIITNASGCQSAESVPAVITVNDLPAIPIITAGGTTTFCAGGSVTLTSSAGTSYLWSTGATTQSINATIAGSYTVSVTNPGGCQSAASIAAIVTVNALPVTPTITAGGSTTFCTGGSVTLTSSAGLNYLWSTGATTQSINATTAGNYTVQVINASGCQSAASIGIIVTVNALPATPTITPGGPTTFCAGGSVTLTSSAGSGYLWSNAATTASINVTTAGSYTVRVTNASGCQSQASVATIVTVNSLPATPTITPGSPTTFCAGGSVTLTSGAEANYLWSMGATTQGINTTIAGNYTVQVINASGCQSAASEATVVNVNALPVVNAGPDLTIPNGTSTPINATITGTGPFTYSWSPSAQLVDASLEDPTTLNLTTSTVFTLTATSTATSCSNTSEVTITISGSALSSTTTATPATVCAGGNVQLYALASGGSGSYTYTWTSVPAGFASSIANPIANPTVFTTYNVTVFDGSSTVTSPVVVTVNALPAPPTITAIGPTTFCDAGSVTLTSSAGTSYLWSTGATTSFIDVTISGSYTVQVTSTNGCQSAVSSAIVVTVNALPSTPTITTGGPTTFCAGGSVTLASSAGTSNLWSGGETTASINVTTAGSYKVRASNASGCLSAQSVATIVTINALPATPTITASGPTTFCIGSNVTLTSSAGTSYLWSTGATTASINVTTAGSYTVRVSENGCQSAASATTIVNVNALPATPTITAGGPTTFCAGSSVTLTSSAGTTYLWSDAAIAPSRNITSAGSYNVQVIDANGCQSAVSSAIVVTVNALPSTPTISTNGPTTFCAGGSVQLTSSSGSSYLWSPGGETKQKIKVSAAGSYTVQVTNASGCQSVASVATIVTVNALPATPTITIIGPTTFCAGGSVTLTSNAGTSYLWSNGATTASIVVTTTGSYTVRVFNVSGCRSAASAAIIVTVNALPSTPTITAGGPTTFCVGGSVTLTSSAGASYQWSTGATTASITVATAGSYSVRVTSASGCQSAVSVATIVTVNTLPAMPTITAGGPTTFCDGGSVTLTSSAEANYLWSGGAITASINVSASGSYNVMVTDGNGCQSAVSSATLVTVNALPPAPAISASGPTTFCTGGSVTLTSSEGTNYLWSSGATTASINVTTTGSYTVQVLNASGCQSAVSAATIVTVNTVPATPTITAGGPTAFCAGGSVTLTSSPETSYLWSNGATTASINVTTAGSYTVRVTSVSGCQSAASVATIVTVNALPATPTITAGGPTTFCADSNVILTSSAEANYLWSNAATTPNINVTISGSYTVQVTDANGCQSATSAVTVVTVNALPATSTITADGLTTFCDGGSVTLTSSAEANYLWSTGATTQSVNAVTAGNYSVQVINANGCQSAASTATIITVNALPVTPTITYGSPTTFCANGSITLTSSSGAGYLWSNGATTQNVVVNIAGSYSVQVTDAIGCQSATSEAIEVAVNALPVTPTITADGPTTFCAGGSVILTSSAEASYLWSNSATTPGINVTTAGSYTVQVTDANGCQSAESAAINVTANVLPATPTITAGSPTTFCDGGSVTLTSSEEAIYLWSTGATTPGINVTEAGSYYVQVTDANGCQSMASIASIVTINALPATPIITAGGPTTFCDGGSVTLTSSAGTTYLWSDAAISPGRNITSAGSYNVRVTDGNGCQSAASAATLVTVNALPVTPTITAGGPPTFCAGASVTLTSSAEANYLWSTGATTASIIVSTAGSYTIRVTNANGCQSASSASTTVTVNALPVTPIITADGPTTICEGGNVTLTSSVGTSYFWSTGATTASINVTAAGSYTVQVANASGCQSATSAATEISVNVLPVATAGNNGPVFSFKALSLTGGPEGMTTYSWIGPNGFTSNSQSPSVSTSALEVMAGVYTLTVTNANGCSNTATTTVEINELPIPSVITPNNDGKNDYFVIGEISGKVDLTIFNRWGNIEYTNSNYLNDWDGRNNKGIELPNDTYFYILKFESGKIIKGSVLIKR